MHVDNQKYIGAQDLGPRGLRTWVARRNPPVLTLFNILLLPANLLAIRDAAYEARKVDKNILQCFHLHYFLSHYCYLSAKDGIPPSHLDQIDHSVESIEAFELLART